MVQNNYLELLLELGVIGIILFIVVLVAWFRTTKQNVAAWAIMAAFVVQWWFFSGYPNALHIFLLMAFFYVLSVQRRKS